MLETFGSRLMAARGDLKQAEVAAAVGVEPAAISMRETRALGHSSTQMVERHYGHLAPDHLDAVAAAVAGEFSLNSPPNSDPIPKAGAAGGI